MLVVSTGTNGKPFDRLLRAVAGLAIDEELVVQHGPSTIRIRGAANVEYFSFVEYQQLVAAADTVVTHAGVGSVLVALLAGKRPIVVPRLACLGEAVDDHQLEFGHRLAAAGSAVLVEADGDLGAAVVGAAGAGGAISFRSDRVELVRDLAAYLSATVGARQPRATGEAGGAAAERLERVGG